METVAELGYRELGYQDIVFPKLGIEVTIDPTAFTIFGIDVQWYGLIITFGLVLAMIFAFKNMRRVGIDADRAIDAVIGGIIGGIVGARAYYVIMNWDDYKNDLLSVFNTREGGLAIFGGLIGAVLVGGIVAKFRKVKLLPLLDLCGVGFLIGQGIGRWGNFVNQEAFGTNTDSLFCMTGGRIQSWITENYSIATGLNSDVALSPEYAVHPCFLYESAWCLLGAAVLAVTLIKWRKFDGQIILMYMGWYGLGRFFIEGIRTDSLMVGSLRISQAVAAVCVIASITLLIVLGSKVKRMGSDYKLYCNTEESRTLLAQADQAAAERKNRRKQKSEDKTESILAEEESTSDAGENNENSETEENKQED